MTIRIADRSDIDLNAFCRVAWQGEDVALDVRVAERTAETRAAFERFLANNPDAVIYGVTSGYGQMAKTVLSPEQRRIHARRPPYQARAAFGDTFPDRVARGIVLARLTTFVEGYAAVRPEVVEAVAGLLGGGMLPAVPYQGQGGAGEILILSFLFADVAERMDMREKEVLALINGSPAAAALVADAALAARRRIDLAGMVGALAYDALRAPMEHLDPVFGDLWNDPHEAEALTALGRLLEGSGGGGERRSYQAPVSFRILPRMLGRARAALARAAEVAERSLKAVTDNPIYLPPDGTHADGRVLSNGGYHNPMAAPALDGLAAAWADLTQIMERLSVALTDERQSGFSHLYEDAAGNQRYLGTLGFAHTGWSEEARHHARPTFLPGSEAGGFSANDVSTVTPSAWDRERRAGACLSAASAVTALIASEILARRGAEPPPALAGFLDGVRAAYPVSGPVKGFREPLDDLHRRFDDGVFEA